MASLSPSTGTALTNSSGIATIGLNAASSTAGGAATLTAAASVSGSATSNSIGFSVNAAAPAAGVTFTGLTFGANPLSAYGTTSVTATVTPATTPVTVTFNSTCAGSAKATLSSTITTVGGVATASYVDNGCGTTDTITASIAGTTATTNGSLVVTPPATGSLQYVSANPTTISLKGTGGTSSSRVTFKVVDDAGNPLSGKIVTFGLSTTLGGITLTGSGTPVTATSDSLGMVSVLVNAGTMSTPVRVTASTPGATAGSVLNTQSNQLTITTGIPDQDSFSLAATTLNTEGWLLDGLTSTLTARLSDHFNNPVPDGTAVNFTTEGGSVVGSCATVGGACSVVFTTTNPRPDNGRVTVLAFAVGEESFTDVNGNGVADLAPTNEMVDANGKSSDMPEAFVDYNEDGLIQTTSTTALDPVTGIAKTTSTAPIEPFEDFNANGVYDKPDGQYNGVLCNTSSSTGTCSPTKSIHVRKQLVLTMSSGTPALALYDNSAPPALLSTPSSIGTISLPACDNPPSTMASGTGVTYYLRVVDENGNAMPQGTIITFATTNGTLLSPGSYVVGNTSGCSSDFAGCPSGVGTKDFEWYPIAMVSEATYDPSAAKCNNIRSSGALTVTIETSAGGNTALATKTVVTIPVTD